MAPVPNRGRRCDSGMIGYTAAAMAAVHGMTAEEMIALTAKNAAELFGITL
jgi:TatD DNase family protein